MSYLVSTQTVAVAVGTLAAWLVFTRFFAKHPLDVLRGPPRASFWTGNMAQIFNLNGWRFNDSMPEQYDGVVKVWGLLGDRKLLVTDPLALYHILMKDHNVYTKPASFLELFNVVFGRGLLSTYGDQHKRQRKLMNPVFSTAHMKQMVLTFFSVGHKLSDALANELRKEGETEVDVLQWMSRAALELIGEAGLGYSFDPLTTQVHNGFAESTKSIVPALVRMRVLRELILVFTSLRIPGFFRRILPHIPSRLVQDLREPVDTLDWWCRKVYTEKKKAVETGADNGTGRDIMSILLRANMEADESVRLPEDEVIAQMSTLVFAATDTTTNSLARTLWILAQHPNAQQKLRDEIVSARAGRVADLTYDEVDTLPYMDAILRETLRLHAPIWAVLRTPLKDTALPLATPVTGSSGAPLREVVVPRGTELILSLRGLNRATEYWGPDASTWRPERWLEPLPQKIMEAKIPGIYAHLMTFGGGGFSCIGFKVSQLEMKVVLALLIERFAFELPDNKEIKWKMAGIQFPTVAGHAQPSLPLKMRLLEPLVM